MGFLTYSRSLLPHAMYVLTFVFKYIPILIKPLKQIYILDPKQLVYSNALTYLPLVSDFAKRIKIMICGQDIIP